MYPIVMKKFILLLLVLIGFSAMAQPGMPNNPTPVDGVSGLLLLVGAALGIYRHNNK